MSVKKLKRSITGWKVAFIFEKDDEPATPYGLPMGLCMIDHKSLATTIYRSYPVLVKLRINKGATVVTVGIHNKRRCSVAEVVGIYDFYKRKYDEPVKLSDSTIARSFNTPTFKYYVGKTVMPSKKFDANDEEQCGSGIHFFDTEWRARAYYNARHMDHWVIAALLDKDKNFDRVCKIVEKMYEEQLAGREEK